MTTKAADWVGRLFKASRVLRRKREQGVEIATRLNNTAEGMTGVKWSPPNILRGTQISLSTTQGRDGWGNWGHRMPCPARSNISKGTVQGVGGQTGTASWMRLWPGHLEAEMGARGLPLKPAVVELRSYIYSKYKHSKFSHLAILVPNWPLKMFRCIEFLCYFSLPFVTVF